MNACSPVIGDTLSSIFRRNRAWWQAEYRRLTGSGVEDRLGATATDEGDGSGVVGDDVAVQAGTAAATMRANVNGCTYRTCV